MSCNQQFVDLLEPRTVDIGILEQPEPPIIRNANEQFLRRPDQMLELQYMKMPVIPLQYLSLKAWRS